jgi:hypothetical protein
MVNIDVVSVESRPKEPGYAINYHVLTVCANIPCIFSKFQTEIENYEFASPLIGSGHSSHEDTYIEIPDQNVEVILEHDDSFKGKLKSF